MPPLCTLNDPKIKSLLKRLGKPEGSTTEKVNDQARPENVEGAQTDEEVIPSTSSYKSLDATDNKALRLPHMLRKGVKEMDHELWSWPWPRISSGITKFHIGEKVKIYYDTNVESPCILMLALSSTEVI